MTVWQHEPMALERDESDEGLAAFGRVEDILVDIIVIRRNPGYRDLLVRGTGLDGRVTVMRVLRAVDDIRRHGGVASVSAVADRLVIEHSSASRAVDQVVAAGLAAKRPAADDARRVEIKLTRDGQQVIRALDRRRDDVYARLIDGWDPVDVHQLAELLDRLRKAYEELIRP